MEELDIYENADFVQPTQIFSSDSLPANTEVYDYTSATDGTVYGYGKRTDNSNEVRIVKVANGGADNPGSFSIEFTSGDTTDVAYSVSPIQFFQTDESNTKYLYYVTNNSGTVKLKRYDITAGSESEQDSSSTNMTLSNLDGSFDRISMKVIFGDLYITNGQQISKVDDDGVFTEDAFTLPNEWEAVDIVPVSDVALILARYTDRQVNFCKGFWWDLSRTTQFDDSFEIPMGGPQWLFNDRENIRICCAQNGEMRLYQLSGAFPGAVPQQVPNILLKNVEEDKSTQAVSPSKTVTRSDGILMFGLNKTDKTGVYAIGQMDANKPEALSLAKRFSTTDYSNHSPTSVHVVGPNFYASFDDNGTQKSVRCETNNSPDRSSNAVYESVLIDDGDSTVDKTITDGFITTKPLPVSTDVDMYIKTDYGSYSEKFRPSGSSFDTQNGVLGWFDIGEVDKKVFQVKIEFTSNGTDAPKLTAVGFVLSVDERPAFK